MRLKLLVPTRVLVDREVTRIVAEADNGSFCLLPRHVDFLAALVPGLLYFEDETGSERYAAVDEGVLVKRGDEVLVSTRQAVCGADLGELRRTVHDEFMLLDDRERAAHSAVAKLEASFLRNYLELVEEFFMNGFDNDRHRARRELEREIAEKEKRKLKAHRERNHTVWFGLGMFGLVGWSVAIPALIGVALGLWIDSRWPSRFSWTLMLLVVGVALGCLNAWRWVCRESREEDEE